MGKTSDDISGPYESWTTARLDVASKRKKKRIQVGALALLAIVLVVVGLSLSVLFFADLHPLWNRPSTGALLISIVGPPLVGTVLIRVTSMSGRWGRRVALSGLLLMLPLAAMPFAPIFLYANQSGAVQAAVCASYRISKKEVVKPPRGGSAYDLTLSDEALAERVLRVSSIQFHAVSEGQIVWVQIRTGLFGVRYVERISYVAIDGCAIPASATQRTL